ncbi:MAG: glycosyltransferase family 9 protein [Puia sp.]|nr:glycosyltransferase family 9 protein [Puia sp.]
MKRPFVYLIRKRALGDVLWVEPVIKQFAERYSRVIVYTKYPELFLHYPLPNVVFRNSLNLLEKIAWKLSVFFSISYFFVDLERAYEKKPTIHLLSANQQKAGLPGTTEYPRIHLSPQESAFRPGGKDESPYVILHLESFSDKNYRKVYGVDWDIVAHYLNDLGFTVYQLGKQPQKIAGTQSLKTDIRQMISVIHGASFFIGLDSGPSHIAASLGIPSLIFFGAVNPELRHFRQLFKGRFLQQPCEFAGCYHRSPDGHEVSCRLVGDLGIPKCSLHTTEYVLNNIDLLITDYKIPMIKKLVRKIKNKLGIKELYPSETSKVRHWVIGFCNGYGCDIGFGGDKIKKENCVGIDYASPYAYTGKDKVDIACDVMNEKIPVDDNTFDYVYTSHLIEDFRDTRAALEEFIRILKTGGNLILVFPDQPKYEEHCIRTGQPLNQYHVHKDMGLKFMHERLREIPGIRYESLFEKDREIDYNVVMVLKINKVAKQ